MRSKARMRPLGASVGIVLTLSMLIVNLAGNVSAGADIPIKHYPGKVRAGDPFSVEWNVFGDGQISHTNVHWGYSSGMNASDYSNSGKIFTGHTPASFNDTTLRAPLLPGTIYLRVHVVMDQDYLSVEFTISITPLSNSTKPEATIISYPVDGVQPGAMYNITWQITGGKVIQHTNVHWGTQTNNYRFEGESLNSTSPQIFTNVLTAPAFNVKVYFIIHYKVDSIDNYTKEYSFQVGVSPIPEIVNVNYPSSTVAGGKYNISWRIEGGSPGNISLTRVIWGKEAGKLTEAGNSYSGSTPRNFQDMLIAPLDRLLIHFEIQYVVDGMQYFTPEYDINVTGGVQVVFRFIVPPPPNVPVRTEFAVTWQIEGGNRIEMTRFEWGTEKGLHTKHGNVMSGMSGDSFTDLILKNDTNQAARYYYAVYYKIDGVEFTSAESSFFVYQPGAGLNEVTIGIILFLVMMTLLLAYLLMRSQRRERQKQRGEIGITDAKRAALDYLTSFYKAKGTEFKFYDAYPAGGDGFEIVYTSPQGLIRYKIYVDLNGTVVRFTGARRRA